MKFMLWVFLSQPFIPSLSVFGFYKRKYKHTHTICIPYTRFYLTLFCSHQHRIIHSHARTHTCTHEMFRLNTIGEIPKKITEKKILINFRPDFFSFSCLPKWIFFSSVTNTMRKWRTTDNNKWMWNGLNFFFLVWKGMRSNLMFKTESDLSVAKIRYGMHKNDAFLFDKMRIYTFFLSSFCLFLRFSIACVWIWECVKNQRNKFTLSPTVKSILMH